MREEIEKVLEAMREDYKRWSDNCMRSGFETPRYGEMIESYCNGL